MTNDSGTDRLIALAEKKLQILKLLLDLSTDQIELAEAKDISQLLVLLSKKDTLLNDLRAVQAELAPYQQQTPESRSWPSEERRAYCRQLVAQSEAALTRTFAD